MPLFINDTSYPKKLAVCSDAPTILYYKGSAPINQARIISIVGTRLPTHYGKWLTSLIVEQLAPYNPLIISGLAYGIDVTAHQTALDCNLQTIGPAALKRNIIRQRHNGKRFKQLLCTGARYQICGR